MHLFFFFNDTATTEIYTLSLHDALPISRSTIRTTITRGVVPGGGAGGADCAPTGLPMQLSIATATSPGRIMVTRDRKSTRLNSSHGYISYAVFCLKKKNMNVDIPGT